MDLVLRLDVRRYRETMGPNPEQSLGKIWQEFLLDWSGAAPSSTWIAPTVAAADTLWLGCRLGTSGCKDFVAVLRGRFVNARVGFGFGPDKNERDLGGGWLSYDRETTERSTIARVYLRAPELAILVSSAEVDSAERCVEQSASGTQLVPRESGLLSVTVRSHALANAVRSRSTKAADWLDASERVEIRVEPEATRTLLTFAVTFGDATRAERAAQALKILMLALTRFEPKLKSGDVRIEQLGNDVVLRLGIAGNGPTLPQAPLADDPAAQ
jgi:hypothetical protein